MAPSRLTIIIWVVLGLLLVLSLIKRKELTMKSLKKSKKMMQTMLGQILGILFLIGLILTFLPPELIEKTLGNSSNFFSTFLAAAVGSITLIPAFVAFPLVGSIVDKGANLAVAAAFLTTLTMVGFVTFPLEKKTFGTKFALIRNGLSFVFALIIAVLMGVIL